MLMLLQFLLKQRIEEVFGIKLLEYQKILLRDAHEKYKQANLDLPVHKLLEKLESEHDYDWE